MIGSAVFSLNSVYRYELCRRWLLGQGICCFLMLNPSTAGEKENDPTVTRCIDFAERWGYRGLSVGNIFALRSTDPSLIKTHQDPVGPENDLHLSWIIRACDLVVCAWGNDGKISGRGARVRAMVERLGKAPHVLRLNKDGSPAHPLYLPGILKPEKWQ